MPEVPELICRNLPCEGFPAADAPVWAQAEHAALVDTVTGEAPPLSTAVSAFRDDAQGLLYFKFDGEDTETVSPFRMHDEPIWQGDVFEAFIADEGDLSAYKELEVSPDDVHFDGLIRFDTFGRRSLNMSYDIANWRTQTTFSPGAHRLVSVWALPYAAFSQPPQAGGAWRVNFFRVDMSGANVSLQAWSATMAPNFHVPERFGRLVFA